MVQEYYTHDNGGRPFLVKIYQNYVDVYKEEGDNSEETRNSYKKIYRFKFIEIFIGKSPKSKMTEFSSGYGSDFDGNSILLKIDQNRYIFIGEKISEFETTNDITEYISPVGNNDVPYPFAIDSKGNYYLMAEEVFMKKRKIPKHFDDPHLYFYALHLITPDRAFRPPKQPLMKSDINKFFIGEDQYTLTWEKDPSKDYDRLIKDIGSPLKLVYKDGKSRIIDKQEYIKLMNDFGKVIGCKPMKIIKVIQERLY